MAYIQTVKTGDLALYDAFLSGCIPCKVIAITGKSGPCGSDQKVTIKLTAQRPGYKRGEVITDIWGLNVMPRKAVHGNRIRFYTVQVD